jgi:hypothetical protein
MYRTVTHPKNIAVLEGYWSDDAEHRLSVAPLLKLLSRRDGTRYVMLFSSTFEEFQFNLEIARTVKRGGILVLGFHGSPGKIHLLAGKMTIEDLSAWLGKDFGKKKYPWIIFFDSCLTLNVEKERIQDFMASTGIRTVIGFKKKVDFVDAAAIDLLLLDWLQFYTSVPRLWKRFRKVYKDLVAISGLEVHHNGHRT